MIRVALRAQRKGFAEEGSHRVDILVIFSSVAFETSPCEVGESCRAVRMANWTLVQNQLEILYSVIQVRDPLQFACRVLGESCVACIRVSSNLAVDKGLQLAFSQQS